MVISFELNGKIHRLVLVKFECLPMIPSITMPVMHSLPNQNYYGQYYISLFSHLTSFPILHKVAEGILGCSGLGSCGSSFM